MITKAVIKRKKRKAEILQILQGEDKGLSPGEIGDIIGVFRTTAYSYLSSLEQEGKVYHLKEKRGYKKPGPPDNIYYLVSTLEAPDE